MKKHLILSGIILIVAATIYWPHKTISPGHLGKSHAELENKCFTCHKAFSGISNDKCIACHKTEEIGSDKTTDLKNCKIQFHKHLQTQNCTSCHTDHKGKSGSMTTGQFNHTLVAQSIISNCNTCHNSPDDNLHNKINSTSCNKCHTTESWSTATFNHADLNNDILSNCSSCHASPTDDFHQKQPLNSCLKCHTTNKWTPSTFDHSDYFTFDKHHPATCSNCHLNNNYLEYTCTSCHEHNLPKLVREHREEGITNITNCVSCHKSGNEHDIRRNKSESQSVDSKKVREYLKDKNKEAEND